MKHPILFALTALLIGALTIQAQQKPNIIFIFADDWGFGDVGVNGSKKYKTPHLDQMAAEGTNFHQFTVASPVCSPSRTAVMTGQFPARHSIHEHFAWTQHHERAGMPDWLDPEVVMLPRLLKQAGYKTAHFGKWHLTNDHIPDAPLPTLYGYDESAVFNGVGPRAGSTPPDTIGMAIDFIERHQQEPFFINLWIHETHTPFYPKEEYAVYFPELEEGPREYAAVVAEADEWVGKLLVKLKALKLSENTLVVFSSDNGPENTRKQKVNNDPATGPGLGTFYSRGETAGLKGRKRSLYEGGIRVPFIVYWPGTVPAGKVDNKSILNAVDLLPTFCALAGVTLPQGYESDGENILPALLGQGMERTRPIFYQFKGASAVRDGKWKLWTQGKRIELYDIFADRGEKISVAAEHPEVVARLSRMLSDWKASLPTEPPAHCFSKERTAKNSAPPDRQIK